MKAKSFFIILFSKKYIVPSDLIPVSIESGTTQSFPDESHTGTSG